MYIRQRITVAHTNTYSMLKKNRIQTIAGLVAIDNSRYHYFVARLNKFKTLPTQHPPPLLNFKCSKFLFGQDKSIVWNIQNDVLFCQAAPNTTYCDNRTCSEVQNLTGNKKNVFNNLMKHQFLLRLFQVNDDMWVYNKKYKNNVIRNLNVTLPKTNKRIASYRHRINSFVFRALNKSWTRLIVEFSRRINCKVGIQFKIENDAWEFQTWARNG